jgi:hypothetical protein
MLDDQHLRIILLPILSLIACFDTRFRSMRGSDKTYVDFHSALEDNMVLVDAFHQPSAILTVLVCPLLAAAYMSSTCWPDVVGRNFAASCLQHWGRHSTLALKLGL